MAQNCCVGKFSVPSLALPDKAELNQNRFENYEPKSFFVILFVILNKFA